MPKTITYLEAINEAIVEELRLDDKVLLMGEDIGVYGGGFGVTRGLLKEFGPERIIDTPISEAGFVGAAIGAAITGLRPIVEIQFSDFLSVAFDQLCNEAAKTHYMSAGKLSVPLVVRTAAGSGTGAAAQHSQSQEAIFCHIPGLKIVVPSNPYDAKGLTKTAIHDNNPVIIFEQKLLYKTQGEIPDCEYTIPFGEAKIKRSGCDATIVAWGRMVDFCLEAATILSEKGIDVEIIDPRTLVPLDSEAIIKSVEKTKHLIIVHEAVERLGFGAEISAIVSSSEAFYSLKAPICRVCGNNSPIPFSKELERLSVPTVERIVEATISTIDTKKQKRHFISQ